MRRKERELKSREAIDKIIRSSTVCYIGLCTGTTPYVVPVCFGYDGSALYFHCADTGRKLDMLRENPRVAFQIGNDYEIVKREEACKWGFRYRSVMGTGTAALLDDRAEKLKAYSFIMQQYSPDSHQFVEAMVDRTAVVRIHIEEISGKQGGY